MAARAVFLDRDDTLIHDPGYIAQPQQVRLKAGAADALRRLAAAGWRLVVATNQSGIARGLLTERQLAEIHDELRRQLADGGAAVDAIYYSPYHPEGVVEAYRKATDCRKPGPGMLLRAAREMDLDLAASWMIGDSLRDTRAGKAAGCRTILLASALPQGCSQEDVPTALAPDLPAAADIVLSRR
jgi:D-glycero-D-manno-heptose 1,7-bisphosphate phosphatase